jgi:Uma2 family endonuclease
MSIAQKTLISPQEYLARERQSEIRHEYYQGEMFAMTGASWEHASIKDNLAFAMRRQLDGGSCRVRTTDLRVKIFSTGLYTYPDIIVVCGEPEFEDNTFDTLLNPCTLVEVLSDSTEAYDRGEKFGHYRQIAALKEYVLVSQDKPLVERFVRQENDAWLLTVFHDLAQTFDFAAIRVSVPMADIYRDVTFDNRAGR